MSLKNNLHNIAEYVELFELLRNILFYDVVNKERSMAKNSIYMSSIQPIMPDVAFILSMFFYLFINGNIYTITGTESCFTF